MRTNRLGTVAAIASALLLGASTQLSAAEATQSGKPQAAKAGAKCCADASKAKGCQKDKCFPKGECCVKAKCCSTGSEKPCCRKDEAAKDCGKAAGAKGCEKKAKGSCCAKAAARAADPRRPCRAAQQPGGSKPAARATSQPKPSKAAAKDSKKPAADPAAQWAKAVARLKKIGYTDEDIAFLPRGAVLASAGAKSVVAYANLKRGETVVDLGCGGGIDCLLAARRVGSGGKVIGVDMSDKALATARENLQGLDLRNVEFRQGRLEKLPIEDASVNVAISNCVGIVMRGDAAVLSEAARVLKPGGRLVTTGRLRDEYREKLQAAGFTTIEQPAAGMIVAKKAK